jgi:hypothetical protein
MAVSNVLEVGEPDYGLCAQCGNPAIVVKLRVRHSAGFVGKVPPYVSLWICESCVDQLRRAMRFRVSPDGRFFNVGGVSGDGDEVDSADFRFDDGTGDDLHQSQCPPEK